MKEMIVEKLRSRFGEALESVSEFRGESTLVVQTGKIKDICKFLRDDDTLRFDSLRDLCGVDYFRPNDRYEVVYNIFSIPHQFRLRVKVRVSEADLHVPTVTDVWKTAEWHERETFDMFGIVFDGHPDLRRMYMPEDFEHYPLRKDFPLMGIPGPLPLPR